MERTNAESRMNMTLSSTERARREKTNALVIRTPEGIAFSMLLAGPVTRFLAWSIDLACIAAVSSVTRVVLGMLGIISMDIFRATSVIVYFLVSVGYGIATEWYWRGQTVGKRMLSLRVMDEQGLRLHPSQIIVRNLMRFVDSLPAFYLVGGIASLLGRNAQRLGDLAANTVVIRNPRIFEPDLNQLLAGKYNSLREYPHLGARLRQRVTPHEASVVLQALMRRDELAPDARVELFKQIATHLRHIVEFPEEAIFGVSDEHYATNVVDILYREKN